MAYHAAGRHRAPGRFNPLTELTGIAASAAQPAVKTSAVLAASGGLVAAFALPAQAASAAEKPSTGTTTAASVPAAVQAPAAAAPTQTDAFGVIGFKATAKPKPKPKPAARARPGAGPRAHRSRQPDRSRSSGPATDPTKPATGGVLGIAAQYAGIMYTLRRHQPVDRLRLLGLHPVRLPPGRASTCRALRRSSASPPPRCRAPSPATSCSSARPAYHVGIYAGNGKMWDSPRTGKAVALRDIWSSSRHLRAPLRVCPRHTSDGP